MADITVGGHRVRYLAEGAEDAPLAVFAHCSLAHSGLWRPVMAALSDRWRCVALDMPGHGGTERGDETISLQFQAASFVEGIAEAFGASPERPAHLVGLSLGGAVMGRVAHRSPAITRSLTMLEPIFFQVVAGRDEQAMTDDARVMDPVVEACRDGRFHDGAKAFMNGWGQPGQFERMPKAAQDAIAKSLSYLFPDFQIVDASFEGQITREGFTGMTMPTLLLEGEETRYSAKSIQEELAALMPNAERDVVPKAGHLSPVDQPEAVAEKLRAFWDRIERA